MFPETCQTVILKFYFVIKWYSVRICIQHSRDVNNQKALVSFC